MRPTKEQLERLGITPAPADKADPVRSRRRVPARLTSDGGAEQSHRESVNINSVLANYMGNGARPAIRRGQPFYADVSDPMDLQRAMELVADALDRFMDLPAAVRSVAGNSPLRFIAMLEDELGVAQLKAAGLEFVDEEIDEPEAPPSQASSPSPAAQPDAEAPQEPE